MVYHVLKNGTITNDITGHVVKAEDAKAIYNLIDSMNNKTTRRTKSKEVV